MKDCEGCPFYDEGRGVLARIKNDRTTLIDITAGTARMIKEAIDGTLDPEEEGLFETDKAKYIERVIGKADAGRDYVVDALAQMPELSDTYFDKLDFLDRAEQKTTEKIEQAQATCTGPALAKPLGGAAIEPNVVCTSETRPF